MAYEWVMFAVGAGLGICFATACLVFSVLIDEWRDTKK